MTPPAAPAVIVLEFEPVVGIGGVQVAWQALALAALIALAIALFARGVRRRSGPVPAGDIAFVVLGAVPGAVVGGRLVHALAFWDVYGSDPAALLDLGRGSLSLAGAVAGGALTAAYVCRMLGGRVGAWADSAAVPLLVVIGGGKLAMLLAGAGQGLPWAGRGGVAFAGTGPWASTDATLPAYPAQLLEGIWALLAIPVVVWLERQFVARGWGGRGLVLLGAGAWWLVGRSLVAVWWRDPPVVGPLGAEGVVALAMATLMVAAAAGLILAHRGGRAPRSALP